MEPPFLVERLARFSVWVRKDRSVRGPSPPAEMGWRPFLKGLGRITLEA